MDGASNFRWKSRCVHVILVSFDTRASRYNIPQQALGSDRFSLSTIALDASGINDHLPPAITALGGEWADHD
jgi:hypothetical protein